MIRVMNKFNKLDIIDQVWITFFIILGMTGMVCLFVAIYNDYLK